MFGRKSAKPAPAESPLMQEVRGILSRSAGQHPLDVAARLTALFSTQEHDDTSVKFIAIRDIDHPTVCELPPAETDPVGLSFTFYGEGGETGLIYLTTEFGLLAPQGTEPGPRVPADLLSRFVSDYDQAVRTLVQQRAPIRSPEEAAQMQRLKSELSAFLG
jgi:hypothetical protein